MKSTTRHDNSDGQNLARTYKQNAMSASPARCQARALGLNYQ